MNSLRSKNDNQFNTQICGLTAELDEIKKQLDTEQSKQKERLDFMSKMEEQHANQIQGLTIQLNDFKQRFESEKLKQVENSKIIFNLMREKKLLSAQVKQLELNTNRCMTQSSVIKLPSDKQSEEEDTDSEYEVDFIVNHKIVRKQRQFLVRWKGYPPSHDSWVKEQSLNCPLILKSYLKDRN